MARTLPDALTDLTQVIKAIDSALLATQADGEHRPEKLAAALGGFRGHALYACLLLQDDQPDVAALDEKGKLQAAWAKSLREPLLQQLEPGANGHAGVPAGLPPMEYLVSVPIRHDQRVYGALAVGAAAADEAVVTSLLQLIAAHLAQALYLEGELGGPEDVERRQWLGFVSETTSIVAHEFNNFLNGIMLHVALLKQEAPQQMIEELDVVKRLATQAANLVKRLQQYNGQRRLPLEPTDLNHAIEDTLARLALPKGVTAVHRELASGLPRIQATRRDLARLLELLFKQAGAAMEARPGPVKILTQPGIRKVELHFADSGPGVEAEVLPRLFEPFFLARPGAEEPGLALCHTLARRLHASLRAENRPQGGLTFVLEFTPAGERELGVSSQ
jgi:signal transduction histidine kinase